MVYNLAEVHKEHLIKGLSSKITICIQYFHTVDCKVFSVTKANEDLTELAESRRSVAIPENLKYLS